MELTAELFRDMIELPEEPPEPMRAREQRRTPRTRLDVRATLIPFSDTFAPDNLIAPVRNLSRGGFGFLHDRPLPLGEHFVLLLPDDSGWPIAILCTVAYWQPLAAELCAIGAKFTRVLRDGHAGLPLVLEDAVSGELTGLRKAS